MESKQVKILLDKFFEGNTTLEEEHLLEIYFQQDEIAESFLPFQSYFIHTRSLQSVTINKKLSLPKNTFFSAKKQRIASIAAVGLTVFWFTVSNFTQPAIEELAFSTFKENMFLMSNQLNRAEQDITYVNYIYSTSDQLKK
jgi:hypothetical protein